MRRTVRLAILRCRDWCWGRGGGGCLCLMCVGRWAFWVGSRAVAVRSVILGWRDGAVVFAHFGVGVVFRVCVCFLLGMCVWFVVVLLFGVGRGASP